MPRSPLRVEAACLPLLLACASPDRPSDVSVADSAGVQIVTSSAPDHPLPWTLTRVRVIGGADTGAASFTSAGQSSVTVDPGGRLYVLDADAHRVVVFDTAGNVLRVMGRHGGGPGELMMPIRLWSLPDGTVEVVDLAKRSIVRWGSGSDRDGHLPEISLQDTPAPAGPVLRSGDTTVMMFTDLQGDRRAMAVRLTTATDTVVLAELDIPLPGPVQFSCVGINLPKIFTPRLQMTLTGGTVAVSAGVPYVVSLFEGGRHTRSVRRPITPLPADRSAIARLYPEGMTIGFTMGARCVITVEELEEKLGTAPHVPLTRDLALAPDGALWVQRFTFGDEPAQVDVFNPDGAYLGTLTGHPAPLGFSGDLVFFAEKDEETGGSVVGVWRVTR